ncbi:hypothetical protein SOVF_033740 [Spinacia oleracea]|nr:hypothetical protein SOVF_033740 [Spinacia oleracea]
MPVRRLRRWEHQRSLTEERLNYLIIINITVLSSNLYDIVSKNTDATAIRAVLAVAIAFAAIAAFSSAAARVASAALANMYNIQVIAQSSTMGDFVKNNNQQLAPHVVSMIVSQLQEARPSIPKDASSTLHVSERNGQSGGTSRTINQVRLVIGSLAEPLVVVGFGCY